MTLSDHLGSSSIIIDKASSELVERTTYAAYGNVEAEFRPGRWGAFRDTFKFTGKEEDIEIGLTYFGARYYQSHLGRWASADPLAIHDVSSDLNPYAYVGCRVMTRTDPLGLQAEPIPEVCVCLRGRAERLRTAEQKVHRGEYWTPYRPYPGSAPPTPSSSPPSAFDVQISRIANKMISAIQGAATDTVLGAVDDAIQHTGSPLLAAAAKPIIDANRTSAGERNADYWVAMVGITALTADIGGEGAAEGAVESLAGRGAMASGTSRALSAGTIARMTRAVENRMRALGVPKDAIGILGGRGFNPAGSNVGGNIMGVGIEVDAAVFGPIEGYGAWAGAKLTTRVDAVIAHEYAEFLGASHATAVETAPNTALPISDAARQLLSLFPR